MKTETKAGAEMIEQKFVKFEVLTEDNSDGTIRGQAMVFGGEHPTSSWQLGPEWKDRVEPGAFTETLAAHAAAGSRVLMQFMHERGNIPGVWTSVKESKSALNVEGKVSPNAVTPSGVPLLELLRMGAIGGLSIGFRPTKVALDEESKVRRIQKADLAEISVVDIPGAGPSARVTDVKSDKRGLEAGLIALGLSRREAKAMLAGGFSAIAASESNPAPSKTVPEELAATKVSRLAAADTDAANESSADAGSAHGAATVAHAKATADHVAAAHSNMLASKQAADKGDADSAAEFKAAADMHTASANVHSAATSAMQSCYQAKAAPVDGQKTTDPTVKDNTTLDELRAFQKKLSLRDADGAQRDAVGSNVKSVLGLMNDILDDLRGI